MKYVFKRKKHFTDKNGLIMCTVIMCYTKYVTNIANKLADIALFLLEILFKVVITLSRFHVIPFCAIRFSSDTFQYSAAKVGKLEKGIFMQNESNISLNNLGIIYEVHTQNLPKTNISYCLICTCTCAY